MQDVDVASLGTLVAWSTFAIAFVLGAVVNRTHFCPMGALSDIVNIGDWTRMRMWACAIGVAILGTQGLAAAGLIDPGKSFYTAPRLTWLSSALGGAAFGFGMVLASGCGSKTLVRLGAGSLKSLVVLVVMGLVAYMTMRGATGVFRAAVLDPVAIDLARGQDLPRLLGGADASSVTQMRWIAGGAAGLALIGFALAGGSGLRSADALLGALTVGLAVVAVWYVSGHLGHVAEDPDTLQERFVATNSGRMESLTFVGPVAFSLDLLMLWSDKARGVTLGIASVAGVVLGSAAYALATRSFRWEGFRGAEDTANHVVGAALMGFGGVTAMGCTIGQGVTGLSTLALGSVIATAGIVAGGVAGLKYQAWRVERMA